jgi:hypothetical protein
VKVPDTFAATIAPDVLKALDAALGPPLAARAPGTYEVELEVAGEGTFTLTATNGVVTAKKGFAKGDPLLSAKVPKGGWPLLQKELQAAVDGFPHNAELKRRQDDLKALKQAEIVSVVKGIERLKSIGVTVDMKGIGTYEIARGTLDEVTKRLTLVLDGKAIEGVLAGGSPDELKAEVKGDRGVGAEIAAALGPVLARLKRR